jgi:recombination protein RecA
VDLVTNNIDLLIIDSMSVQLPQSYFADGEMKGLEGTNQIGTFAKNYASMVNMLNNVNKNTCVVVISQVRNKFHQHGASKSLMGGEAAEHINSTIIKFWSPTTLKEALKGKVKIGDLILERPIGRTVTWTIEKARGEGMGQSNTYDMYYKGDNIGVDLTSEIINYGIEFGVIAKSGNWLSYDELKANGKDSFGKVLRENPEIQEMAYKELLEKVAA